MAELVSSLTKIPSANRQVFEMLFSIEAALRELIIETLATDLGEQWFKTLPPDIKDKCQRGRLAERSANWTTYVDHHPLYYADFPDLGKTISAKWNQHFKALFSDKEVLLGSLRALEPIRNKVAHNRKVTESDSTQVEAVLAALRASVGDARFQSLVERCTTAPHLGEVLSQLSGELDRVAVTLETVAEPAPLAVWPQVQGRWWFDEEFLLRRSSTSERALLELRRVKLQEELKATESKLARTIPDSKDVPVEDSPDLIGDICCLFELYLEYSALPRGRGVGHVLETWVRDKSVTSLAERAGEAVRTIAGGVNNG